MKQTAAQHQKQLDDSAVIESLQEAIEAEMREELLAGRYIEIRYRRNVAVVKAVYDRGNVVDGRIGRDSDEFNEAGMLASTDPIAAGLALHALKVWAVEQVIGLAKTREAAEYMMEDDRSEAA